MKYILLILNAFSMTWAASVRGTVTDPQGAPVPGARVSLFVNGAEHSKRIATSSDGGFRFENATGVCLIQVERDGFRVFARTVIAENEATVNVQLEVAGVPNTVLVTAERGALTLDQTAKAISVVDASEIQDRDEYALFEILRGTPGVHVRNQGGPGQFTQIRLRGLKPDAAQVLIDGMRFRDASTIQGDASSFTSAFNFVNLNRVEVLRGSGSSLYGTGAVGGSINLVTEQGGSPAHGEIQMEGGGLGFARGRASLGGGWRENRLVYSGGFTHVNVTKGVDGNDRARSTGGQGFIRYDLSPRVQLSHRFFATDDMAQLNTGAATTGIPAGNFPNTSIVPVRMLVPGQVSVLNAGGRPDYGEATLVPGRDDPDNQRYVTFYSNMTTLRGDLTASTSWQASWQHLATERKFANGPGGIGFQPLGFASISAPLGNIDTVDARLHTGARQYRLTFGYEFEREQFRDRQDNNQPGNARLIVRSRIQQRSNAVYVQNQLSLLQDRLQLSASGRAQFFDLRPPEFDVRGATNVYAGVAVQSPPRALTGDVSAAYFVRRTGTKLRAHAGNSYRAPALYERYGGGFSANQMTGLANFTPYGDPRLSPDRYNSFDWGMDQYLFAERIRLSATHFYVRTVQAIGFNGAIVRAADPFGRTSGYFQGAGAINRGLELAVEARPSRSTVLRGSYTYTNANNDRDLVVASFFRVLNVPVHTAALTATQRMGRRADVTFDIFRSGQYYINYFAAGRNRAFEFPGFTKADVTGAYRLWMREHHAARAFARVENVFQRTYYENGVLNPKAWAVVGLAYSF